MSKIKGQVMVLGFLCLSLFLVSGCDSNNKQGADQEYPKEVRIGIIRVPNDKQVAIAENYFSTYFDELGISQKFVFFDSGVAANQAFASGSIDFAEMGYTNGVVALGSDLPVKLIWLHEIIGSSEGLVVQGEPEIRQVADLVGKKIATPFSSTAHYSLLNSLKEAGIADQVTLLDMQTSEIVAAWERGDIDGAYTWEPTLSVLKEKGQVIIDSQELAAAGYLTANIELVHENFAKKYPELVTSYLDILNQGVQLYQKEPKKAGKAAAKALDITETEALAQMAGTRWLTKEEQLQEGFLGTQEKPGAFSQVFLETAEFLKDQGVLAEVPTSAAINQFIDTSYLEATLK